MKRLFRPMLAALAGGLLLAQPLTAFAAPTAAPVTATAAANVLVDVAWLERELAREGSNVLVLDASSARAYAAKHIAGAVSADLYSYAGPRDPADAAMEQRLRAWGVAHGRKIVIYDEGGGQMAPRLYFDLYSYGVPASDLVVLDGGLAKWVADGKPVTKDVVAPKPGDFKLDRRQEPQVRARFGEFLTASGDTTRHAVVEALGASYHFGETKFFDRRGHVPNAIMMPSEDFYRADKTFKSPSEIRAMLDYLGVKPEQEVLTHCGGGVAAAVPFFALRYLAGYPKVRLYKESQIEWLQDERGLPFWTYDAPYLKRDMAWLNGWSNKMMRMYGVAKLSVVDVRAPEAYGQGHVPFALNVPAEQFKRHLDEPARLAETLAKAGVDPSHEAVIVSDGGLNEKSALAFVMLERAGQKKVSLLMQSVDQWGQGGLPLATDATIVGTPASPKDLAVPPVAYSAAPRAGVLVAKLGNKAGAFPQVFIAAGKQAPAKVPVDGAKLVHIPYASLLDAHGAPKPAGEIWTILSKAGVPRYAELIVIGDELGEAAVNYVVLKLMGFPDIKVLALAGQGKV